MNLEYFIASLPLLQPGHAPGISAEEFRAACREQLDPALAQAALALLEDRESAHPFARAWRDRETMLRNAVARRRAARGDKETPPEPRPTHGSDLRIEHGVAAAFEQPDPLQREQALNRLRWHVAAELQGVQPFHPAVVLAYAVKLRILSIAAAWDETAGERKLEQLTTLPERESGASAGSCPWRD